MLNIQGNSQCPNNNVQFFYYKTYIQKDETRNYKLCVHKFISLKLPLVCFYFLKKNNNFNQLCQEKR